MLDWIIFHIEMDKHLIEMIVMANCIYLTNSCTDDKC